MAITKKPKRNRNDTTAKNNEQAAQAFISGANKQAKDTARKPVMIRFDPDLLERVDAAAKRRGISRSAWVQFTLSLALDEDEG